MKRRYILIVCLILFMFGLRVEWFAAILLAANSLVRLYYKKGTSMARTHSSIVAEQASRNNWSLERTAEATHIARQMDHTRQVAYYSKASGSAKAAAMAEIDALQAQLTSVLDRWGGGDY
jgi:hypothetical protein